MARHLTTVGSSLARVTCETSQVLLAGGEVFFLCDFLFLPHLTKISEIILTGRKTQIIKQKKSYRKIPYYLETRKIAVNILKFEQCASTIQ